MMKRVLLTSLFLVLMVPALAFAQDAQRDRVAFGEGVRVSAGEVVHDAVSFGGDTVIAGHVTGDAVSFGGSVVLLEGSSVEGDISAMGGSVVDERSASGVGAPPTAHHEDTNVIDSIGAWIQESVRNLVSYVLLFLLGLMMIGVTRERLGAMQVTMVRDGLKTAGVGLLGYVAAVLGIIAFAVTIIGIPAAIVLGLALSIATYVGLAAAATVIGAAVPSESLKGKEVQQLGLGVAFLFICSIVPLLGTLATAVAACLGVGALVRTRFGLLPPADLPENGGSFDVTPAPV